MSPSTPRSFWVVLSGSLVLAAACGPSLQVQHEDELRFEHCYRLDADPKIAPSHRGHCWKDWTSHYSADQPLDRVEYAQRRIAALDSGDTRTVSIRPGKGPESRVFEELNKGDQGPAVAPTPTSAHAPPPAIEPPPPPRSPDAGPGRPGSACTADCARDLDQCGALCATKHADCGVCREDYRRCMRRCFE